MKKIIILLFICSIGFSQSNIIVKSVKYPSGRIQTDYDTVNKLRTNWSIYNNIQFDTTVSAPTHKQGKIYWDTNDKTLAIMPDISGSVLQVGQEQWIRVRNNTGVAIANGKVVYITGATGQRPTIALSQANDSTKVNSTIGMTTSSISHGADGFVTISGLVRGLSTTGYSEGTKVYLSPTVAGGLTSTKPSGTNYAVAVGTVTYEHGSNGAILVHLNKENGTTTINDGILDWNSTTNSYKPYGTAKSWVSIDTSSTQPSGTQRVNLNGNLYTNGLYVQGSPRDTAYIKFKGSNNVQLGLNAGRTMPTNESYNTYIGAYSGENSKFSFNTFVGDNSGRYNKNGYNCFFGYNSGYNNTGSDNTFYGLSSGNYNSSGSSNCFFGNYSGENNTTGEQNSFLGAYSGRFINSSFNVSFGYMSGYGVNGQSTGGNNVFIGYKSGYSITSGGYNTAIGGNSLNKLTVGTSNVAIGHTSGQNIINGHNNTIIGYGAAANLKVGTSNIIIGAYSYPKYTDYSNRLVIDYLTDTISPFIIGDMNVDTLRINARTRIGKGNKYVEADADGGLRLGTPMWDDLLVDASSLKTVGAVNKPDYDQTELGLLFPDNDTTEMVGYTFQMPHRVKTGSITIYPHVHVRQTTADTAIFKIAYRVYQIGAAIPGTWTIATTSTKSTTWSTGSIHQLLGYGGITITSGLSTIIDIKLYRSPADAITGDVLLKQFDIHVPIDKLGSKNYLSD